VRRWGYQQSNPAGLLFKGILRLIGGVGKIRRSENRRDHPVMSRLFKAIILGSLTGAVGIIGSLALLGLDLEESVGLDVLFSLRGIRQPRLMSLSSPWIKNLLKISTSPKNQGNGPVPSTHV